MQVKNLGFPTNNNSLLNVYYLPTAKHLIILYKVEIITSLFSSVQLLSRVRLFVNPWIAARQASLSITNSWSSLKLMPSSHLILCRPLVLLPPIPPSIRVFSNESTLCMKWPNHRGFYFFLFLLMTVNHVVWVRQFSIAKKKSSWVLV